MRACRNRVRDAEGKEIWRKICAAISAWPTRRVSQGIADYETGRKISSSYYHLDRYLRRLSGIEAEEHGQGEAIARNLQEMSVLTVPVIAIIVGEAGSGGALGLAVANQVWMLENSIYSILSPEGFASILWKDSSRAKEASEIMKLTAADLLELGVIDHIIKEPVGDLCDRADVVYEQIRALLKAELSALGKMSERAIVEQRYKKIPLYWGLQHIVIHEVFWEDL